ncbi:Juvenile hormone-inducible protein [Penaeus vannamei]|uniref:Juvenile hormone-inducible protein n=1 Tax=Penaeus vannamei TaxID=6689 RepID=A0A423T8I4_PENVA|nr:uncharacterized protein LOC113810419 isoform X1 [Penaeus vannamei]ROT72732.1 Juvenile hormone-inducible protein [Penaeus vannamei]
MNTEERIKACHSLITEEAVKEALKAHKGGEARLTSWQIKDFTSKGDNYASVVSSVELDFDLNGNDESITYIVKINPCHGMESFEEMTHTIFLKEAEFYIKLLPQLNGVLREHELSPLAVPECHYGTLEKKRELIFLEDLRPRGFKMFDRRKGLDVAHASLVLKELARLHAASLLLQKKDPEYSKDTLLHRGWINMTDDGFGMLQVLEGVMDTGIMMLKKVGGYESSITWAESTKSKLREIFEKQREPCKHQVICHGDAWNNNLLFKYDEDGVPVEVMLIDLQMCRREPFAVDLNYLLYTSLTGDVRKPNLDALLETYRGHFNGVMETEGEGRLLEGEVLQEFRRLNILGAIFNMMIICPILMEPEDVPDFEMSGDDAADMERVIAELRARSLEMVDTNPLMRPRFLSVFDELMETGLIPASGAP